MKKTIEQILKPVIQEDIQYLLDRQQEAFKIRITNDFKVSTENDDANTIHAIIKTGAGTRATVPGIKAIRSPITIIFQVPINYLQKAIAAINLYAEITNTTPSQIIDDNADDETEGPITYEYKFEWGTSIPTGLPYDTQVVVLDDPNIQEETIQVEQILLTGAIIYTEDLAIEDNEVFMFIAEEAVPFTWVQTTQSYWQIYGTPGSIYDLDQTDQPMPNPAILPSAADAPENTAARIIYNAYADTMVEVYYKREGKDGYVKINGVVDDQEEIQPSIETINLVDQYKPNHKVVGDIQVLSMNILRIPGDPVHDKLMSKFYETRNTQSFDATIKTVCHSLNETKSGIHVVITNLKRNKVGGFEYLSFSAMRR
jgi:hypothetical protein